MALYGPWTDEDQADYEWWQNVTQDELEAMWALEQKHRAEFIERHGMTPEEFVRRLVDDMKDGFREAMEEMFK